MHETAAALCTLLACPPQGKESADLAARPKSTSGTRCVEVFFFLFFTVQMVLNCFRAVGEFVFAGFSSGALLSARGGKRMTVNRDAAAGQKAEQR